MFKLWDFECPDCLETKEALVCEHEVIWCDSDAHQGVVLMRRLPFTAGTAARAQVNPAKTREMFSKAQEMKNKVQGRTPWRKNSYSQTGND